MQDGATKIQKFTGNAAIYVNHNKATNRKRISERGLGYGQISHWWNL